MTGSVSVSITTQIFNRFLILLRNSLQAHRKRWIIGALLPSLVLLEHPVSGLCNLLREFPLPVICAVVRQPVENSPAPPTSRSGPGLFLEWA